MAVQIDDVDQLFAEGSGARTIKALIAGPPGSGKTRMASTWPGVLYLDVEGRLLSVRDRKVKRAKIDSIDEMEELKHILDQSPAIRDRMLGFEVKTVVIDTVDEVARMLQRERLKAESIETFRMADWGWYGDQLRNMLRGFRNIPDLNVLFNCHIKSSEDGETGRVEKKPDISGAVGNEIAGYVDEALLLVARTSTDPRTGLRQVKRFLQAYPDGQHDWLKDHSGKLPGELEVNFEDDYERMAALIFGTSKAPARVAPVVDDGPQEEDPGPVSRAKKKAAAKKAPVQRAPEPLASVVVEEDHEEEVEEPEVVPPSKPEPEPVSEKETVSPEVVEDSGPALPTCAECGAVVDNADVAEVSEIRFGVVLCRQHFAARRTKR